MIKRLLSFIRHMCEPTFSDPKAARWVDLFQKRARFTAQLPEPDVLQRMGIPADNPFWKQDNANPSAGFAVNLGCRVGDALQFDSPANFDAVGADDFGRSVTKFPILETAPHFYFHIANSTFSLDEASRAITPGDFAWTAARVFRDLLKKIESEPDDPAENADDHRSLCSMQLARIPRSLAMVGLSKGDGSALYRKPRLRRGQSAARRAGHHLARCSPMAFQRLIPCFALPWLLFGYRPQT
jgi:hypothetical protein